MSTPRKYWFPAKRYGLGWGVPLTWQGWAVLIAYVALLISGALLIDIDQQIIGWLSYVIGLTGALLVICWRTGEPLRWRWGTR